MREKTILLSRGRRRICGHVSVAGLVLFMLLCHTGTGQLVQPSGAPRGAAVSAPEKPPITAEEPPTTAEKPSTTAGKPSVGRIEIDADQLDYDRGSGWVHAIGNVVIRRGDEVLKADKARVNSVTEEAVAEGNVWLRRSPDERPWTGTELTYNFGTGETSIADLSGGSDPFRIKSERSEKNPDGNFVVHQANLTTCTNATCTHYHVRAKTLTIVPDDYLVCRSATLWFGRVPVLWLPYWRRDLNRDFGWHFYPGYNSRMGAFLLSSYSYPISSQLSGETHLDYRTKRGVAGGQDFTWRDTEDKWSGDMELYFLKDDKPIDDDDDAATTDVDEDRYRARFDHEHHFGDSDTLRVSLDYVSDTDLLEDFFEDDYRARSQPENYLVYTYRGDWYVASLETRKRLNDFYNDLDRLPEVSLDVSRRRLGESAFYYESENSVGYLEKLWKEGSSKDDYSSARLDSRHTVYWPQKHLGFLNVIPRASVRGTYYSDTFQTVTNETVTTTTTTNITTTSSGQTLETVSTVSKTNSVTSREPRESDLRTMVEAGVEVSYKAFKAWEGGAVSPLRHIVEPYANYTYVPEPNLLTENIYQFDSIDALGEKHNVKAGVRNKIQTKHKGAAFDLIDIDVYTYYRLIEDEDTGKDGIGDVYMDSEFCPSEWLTIEADARYDVDESELSQFNAEFAIDPGGMWELSSDYRYAKDKRRSLEANVTLKPSHRWTLNAYGRQNFEESRTEEVGGYIQRNLDCLAIRLGSSHIPAYTRTDGTEREEEWSLILRFWLTAFPDVGFNAKHKH